MNSNVQKRSKTLLLLDRLSNGEKVKCPACNEGIISSVSTGVFRCNNCKKSIIGSVKMNTKV